MKDKSIVNTLIRKAFCFSALWFIMGTSITAQHLHQPEHSSNQKNVFLLMMDTVMQKMDSASGKSTVTESFISQMIPHHEGAIEMAKYEISHGGNMTMIQLAKSILAEQRSELEQMRLWLRQPIADKKNNIVDFEKNVQSSMRTMMKEMPPSSRLTDTDRAFALVMIPHHQAAIDMARAVIKYTQQQPLNSFANGIISSEQIEIEQMVDFLK